MHSEDLDAPTRQIPVGVVGAGTWASRVHIPALLEHPRFRIAGIWTRRPEQSKELADAHGLLVFDSFDGLLDEVEVVDLVVPPDAQPQIAINAASRRKHLILEKPAGLELPPLRRLQEIVDANRLVVEVFVTRFFDDTRVALLRSLSSESWTHAHLEWRSGAFRAGNPFATTWRAQDGPLWDIGPHALSQLEVVLGRVVSGRTVSRGAASIMLELGHESGASSTVDIDLASEVDALSETLTLWDGARMRNVELESVEPRPAFARLLDYLVADLERERGTHRTSPVAAGLEDGVRIVGLLQAVGSAAT